MLESNIVAAVKLCMDPFRSVDPIESGICLSSGFNHGVTATKRTIFKDKVPEELLKFVLLLQTNEN